jgi:FAD/FMN-containing dehydrogenase
MANRPPKLVERRLMNDIPDEDLRTIEESFGTRFVRHAVSEAETDAEKPFASVFPESAEEVESLTRLAARHRIPLMARGAGTGLYPGEAPRALVVRFDEMRRIRLPERPEEGWVEAEPGATWMALELGLREGGMGPRVYPTSAPRATIGGWLSENGLGVGSYEYGWLLTNVLSVETVMAGGEREPIEGEDLRYFVGSKGSAGFLVRARLATRQAAEDVPVGATFRHLEGLAGAIVDLYRSGALLWHLAFLNSAMTAARGLEEGPVLFGAYPQERSPRLSPLCRRRSSRTEATSFPVRRLTESESGGSSGGPLGTDPGARPRARTGRTLSPDARRARAQTGGGGDPGNGGPVGRGVASDLRSGQRERGPCGLSAATDVKLVQLASRSWMPERR